MAKKTYQDVLNKNLLTSNALITLKTIVPCVAEKEQQEQHNKIGAAFFVAKLFFFQFRIYTAWFLFGNTGIQYSDLEVSNSRSLFVFEFLEETAKMRYLAGAFSISSLYRTIAKLKSPEQKFSRDLTTVTCQKNVLVLESHVWKLKQQPRELERRHFYSL